MAPLGLMARTRQCVLWTLSIASLVGACGQAADGESSPASSDSPDAAVVASPSTSSTAPSSTCDASNCGSPSPARDGGVDAGPSAVLVVFSAFPAEMAPLLAQTTVESTTTINNRTFRIGTLKGVRVALGLTGMGLGSATATAKAALAQLPAKGVVFSGVAGSKLRIGDVIVPSSWTLKKTTTFAPDPAWLQLATSLVGGGSLCFEHCTVVPSTGLPVCLDHVPAATVGGEGQSDDTSVPVSCQSGGDDVFGCDVGAQASAPGQCDAMGAAGTSAGGPPVVTDNETAAVAAEAAARGLPFIAFRGISDGAGDPLGLPGYPTQFFAYYRLAARNAAAATMAFVERVGTSKP